ncbi:MAG: hypothetical protein F4X32_07340 [Candidatus Dadabacteria bacterium]|nr:hypothetical protein [Candidatus Dadabacteria bacterium]
MGLQNTAATVVGVVGSVLVVVSEEYKVLLIVITGFIILTIQLAFWSVPRRTRRMYNPDAEPYVKRPATGKAAWRQLWATLENMGWKDRE